MAFQLAMATDQMKDGILAFGEALFRNKISSTTAPDYSNPERSSRALQRLRSLSSVSIEDARTALALALMLITYNDLGLGAPTAPISRSALLLAMPWRDSLVGASTDTTDTNIIALLFVEMAECIVLGQVPVFRYDPPAGNDIVDRYYGICHELLPIYYDICCLYNAIKSDDMPYMDQVLAIRAIATAIDDWSPEAVLEEHISTLSDKHERHHFLLQARVFKSAAQLLLLQTQRNVQSDVLAYAKAAQLQGEILDIIQHGPGRPKYVLFPYFVACLELRNMDDQITSAVLQTMNDISNGMAPRACQTMLACLQYIWQARVRSPDQPWIRCIGPDVVIAMGP
jgi:hypothetical protein